MFVIQVIPLIRGTKIDTLSYYSKTEYQIGTFLNIPIRGKTHRAIVTEVKPVSESKTSLKTASFTLRKLPEQTPESIVPKNIHTTAERLTKIYPSSVGAILYQLLPPDVRNGQYQYPVVSSLIHEEDTIPQILTASINDRYISYRSHIRSVLARRGSVLFVVPTSAHVSYAKKHLSQGIEDRVVVFSPTASKHEQGKAYEAFEDTTLARLIITTPSHAYLDRVDLISVIMEKCGNETYRTQLRPYLDHRTALTTYAKATGRSIILGDILPRTEDEYRRRQELYSTFEGETKRIAFTAPLTIIEQKDKSTPEKQFALFSKELKARVENILDSKGRVFMYGARRGIAPVVTCIDCGHIFRCPDSEVPYSLVKTVNKSGEEERWFVSSTSGKKVRAADTCPFCQSWRLRTRGIGIQHVYDEALSQFPDRKILLLDHITGSTRKRAEKVISEFYENRSSILIGTQMCLPYLALNGVDLSVVTSLDAARSNPTWRADENIFRLLLELRELSNHEVMIQTRTTPDSVLNSAKQGSLEIFYNEEIQLRESLSYPPVVTFILLSWTGNKDIVTSTEEIIKTITQGHTADFYNNPNSTGEKILRHALFKIEKNNPAHEEFIGKLKKLPPYIRIEIDPNRIV
jgi:primosomal protein N' (replication factor Y)